MIETFLPTDAESLNTVQVNWIWQPNDRFRHGIKSIFGHRSFDEGGLDNEAHRIRFAGQFFFSRLSFSSSNPNR